MPVSTPVGARPYPGAGTMGGDNVTGLTGFDVSSDGRVGDPSCSDSLNGAPTRIADEQFALAA
ncbi:hypothetical protein BH20ACT4_BH20ACT4_10900 [soil metagenome]